MNISIFILTFLMVACVKVLGAATHAAPLDSYTNVGWVHTSVVSNIYALLGQTGTSEVFQASVPIGYGFGTTKADRVVDFIELDPNNGLFISAVAADGESVRKTSFGEAYGVHFGEVNSHDTNRFSSDRREGQWNGHIGRAAKDYPDFRWSLPSPDKLFDFKKPGVYKMRISFACLWKPESAVSDWQMVKLPVVEFLVLKEDSSVPQPKSDISRYILYIVSVILPATFLLVWWIRRELRKWPTKQQASVNGSVPNALS